ncbi:MAG: DUF1559 domain-containing protein [Planctomycetaceae bacterium]|nr:DUF1559 domain-containing protein [Planctomycetaceae bacterium]
MIELSVAVAIIGVIASVIVPAVFQARESARRVQCQNNLRQTGIALHSFHETHGRFPPGWSGIQFSDDGSILRPADLGCLWAWGAHLLPQLDHSPLFEQLDVSGFSDPPAPGDKLDVSLDVFLCPSDIAGRDSGWGLYRWEEEGESTLLKGYARSNYIAVNGSDASPSVVLDARSWDEPLLTGIFGNETRTTLAEVLDGASNTLAVGERAMSRRDAKEEPRGAVWIRNVGELLSISQTSGTATMKASGTPPVVGLSVLPFAAIHCDANSVVGVTNRESPLNQTPVGFSSRHPGGANFLFADGAVRFISERIETATYERLGAMADGEVVAEF